MDTPLPQRRVLPNRRHSYQQKVHINGHAVFLNAGIYEDGTLGEVFIDLSKQGSALRYWSTISAILFSLALQHGTPLATLVDAFVGMPCEPCGRVDGHARITKCTSVMDFCARSLAIDFLNRDDLADRPAPPDPAPPDDLNFTDLAGVTPSPDQPLREVDWIREANEGRGNG